MGRQGRRDDPSHWLENRRAFHDSVDARCRAANERRDMTCAYWLAAKLKGMIHHGEKITVADVQPDGSILLHLTRPAGINGYTEVRIKVVDDGDER